MLSFGHQLSPAERVAAQAVCAAKKAYVAHHVAQLYANTNPAQLWNAIVKYCEHGGRAADGEPNNKSTSGCTTAGGVESWDELRLSYEGYHKAVYELLFHVNAGTTSEVDAEEEARRRELYFDHPFLSPATFLAFARVDAVDGPVPAVPLYAFAAKRLLLFRLRVQLELAATVVPLPLRDSATGRHAHAPLCKPSASSPLSNALTQDDLENFVRELVPNLRLVRDMPPWMMPYYLCHASRKFMFMCDTRNVGALAIDAVMKSDVFSELLRLFESDARDAVVTFPVGCPVEVLASVASGPPTTCPGERGNGAVSDKAEGRRESGTMAKATVASVGTISEEDTVTATVVSFDGEGNCVDDLYTVRMCNEHGAEVTRVVRRGQLYWSSAAEDFLPSETLCMDNWFSMALMCRIYEHFTLLDVDEDGVLTEDELAHYSSDSFTRLALQRVFECHVPHSGPRHIMDYKTYLNFVIATEHAATRPAMKYIWAMLDLDGTRTFIKLTTLHCFCKELADELVAKGLMDISSESILSEVVDMINPACDEYVTFEDIEHSGHQATILPILLSYRNFYAYDCREQTAAAGADEYATNTTATKA